MHYVRFITWFTIKFIVYQCILLCMCCITRIVIKFNKIEIYVQRICVQNCQRFSITITQNLYMRLVSLSFTLIYFFHEFNDEFPHILCLFIIYQALCSMIIFPDFHFLFARCLIFSKVLSKCVLKMFLFHF